MISPDDAKYKFEKLVDGTSTNERLEIIGGKLTDEEWGDMENEQGENNLNERKWKKTV